ncbi:2-C-methyl-D-erythritol 4-phosphate cytidylyltransferase [Vallitalea longa]|uniref:2-C-methyl-D-erythritol 4-phosphate cytidylyltransferase n=1 Tax=Vallitalea longa TaxID=2936439 RepID=A0A9W6DES6_9FIRM|nr:2-C-methyl-D-erythritol 4-phosphate cytidylyltransferase [Vallitalea longa]GKX30496.1 2-C-methyl-D-erythritol 4-phosphate cytidylyltransferase [Vallitalea longa]
MDNIKCTVIIPAAGKGKRMNTKKSKQYIELLDKPILAYTIDAFEKCDKIDNIILVVGKNEIEYVRKEIVEKYNFNKVIEIIEGGKERQDSVYEGIKSLSSNTDVVLIHDGARPFIETELIEKAIINAYEYGACVVGVRVKDTIKVSDGDNNIIDTPNRNTLWSIQTPQAFKKDLITMVYGRGINDKYNATDDSMLVEKYSDIKVKIVEGAYSNIKITTSEDLIIAKSFLNL